VRSDNWRDVNAAVRRVERRDIQHSGSVATSLIDLERGGVPDREQAAHERHSVAPAMACPGDELWTGLSALLRVGLLLNGIVTRPTSGSNATSSQSKWASWTHPPIWSNASALAARHVAVILGS